MKSREFLSVADNPLSEERIKNIERKGKRKYLSRFSCKDEKLNQEFSELIAKINFEDMKKIFETDTLHSQIEEGGMNFVSPDEIMNYDNPIDTKKFGFYSTHRNFIAIHYKKLKEVAESENINVEMLFLRILGHEETHAVSKMNSVGAEQLLTKISLDEETQSGYSKSISDTIEGEQRSFLNAFNGFDEGVTEWYTREVVVKKYLELHPEFPLPDSARERMLQDRKIDKRIYSNEVFLVNAFIRELSESSGFETSYVRKAIIHGKFSGINFYDEELRGLFDVTFGKEFMDKLASLGLKDQKATAECINFLEKRKDERTVKDPRAEELLAAILADMEKKQTESK